MDNLRKKTHPEAVSIGAPGSKRFGSKANRKHTIDLQGSGVPKQFPWAPLLPSPIPMTKGGKGTRLAPGECGSDLCYLLAEHLRISYRALLLSPSRLQKQEAEISKHLPNQTSFDAWAALTTGLHGNKRGAESNCWAEGRKECSRRC